MGRDAVFSEEDFILYFLRAWDVQVFIWGVSDSQPSKSDTTALLLPDLHQVQCN